MKRIPAGFLLEGFQIEGMAKGMNSLGVYFFSPVNSNLRKLQTRNIEYGTREQFTK